jgi:hypothetical protein
VRKEEFLDGMGKETKSLHWEIVWASGPSNFGTAESAIEFQHGKWRFEVRLRRSKRIFNGIWEWSEVPNMIAETVSKAVDFSDSSEGVPSGLLTVWVRGWYLERIRLIVFQCSEGEPM